MKDILGAAVVIGDIIAAMAAPHILANLRAHPHANVAGAIVIYAALALATLWVISSVTRRRGEGQQPSPRPGYFQFGGRGGRGR